MADQATRNRRRRIQLAFLGLVTVALWSLAVYFRVAPRQNHTGDTGRAPAEPDSAGPAASDRPAGTSTASASAEISASSTTETSASATTTGAAGGSQQLTVCVSAMLPAGSFERGQPDFSFVCDERYPRKAVTQIQAQLSLDRWGTTEATVGMREWAVLGWYEFAALAMFRGQCCADALPLEWTFKLACPFDKAMRQLEDAVRVKEQAAVEAAVSEFTQMATCLTRQGQAPNFGQTESPGPGVSTFRKMLERLRAAARP